MDAIGRELGCALAGAERVRQRCGVDEVNAGEKPPALPPAAPPGKEPGKHLVVTNTEYWMGPDITVAKANQGRVRAFGRVWDFDGRSAEICEINWRGP